MTIERPNRPKAPFAADPVATPEAAATPDVPREEFPRLAPEPTAEPTVEPEQPEPAAAEPEETPEEPEEAPERVVSVEQWVNSVASQGAGGNAALGLAWRDQEHPPFELLGGFVHKMKSEERAAAKPSDYMRRWKAFLKE